MRVSISFASAEQIKKALADLTAQIDKGEEPSVEFFLDDSRGFANAGDETLHLEFVDEGSEEFANPSAALYRD